MNFRSHTNYSVKTLVCDTCNWQIKQAMNQNLEHLFLSLCFIHKQYHKLKHLSQIIMKLNSFIQSNLIVWQNSYKNIKKMGLKIVFSLVHAINLNVCENSLKIMQWGRNVGCLWNSNNGTLKLTSFFHCWNTLLDKCKFKITSFLWKVKQHKENFSLIEKGKRWLAKDESGGVKPW